MIIGMSATGVTSPVTLDKICPKMLGFLGTVSVLVKDISITKFFSTTSHEEEFKMSYVSIREVTPLRGKEMILEERMKQISEIMGKHGAKSALYHVVAGDGAGRYDLQN